MVGICSSSDLKRNGLYEKAIYVEGKNLHYVISCCNVCGGKFSALQKSNKSADDYCVDLYRYGWRFKKKVWICPKCFSIVESSIEKGVETTIVQPAFDFSPTIPESTPTPEPTPAPVPEPVIEEVKMETDVKVNTAPVTRDNVSYSRREDGHLVELTKEELEDIYLKIILCDQTMDEIAKEYRVSRTVLTRFAEDNKINRRPECQGAKMYSQEERNRILYLAAITPHHYVRDLVSAIKRSERTISAIIREYAISIGNEDRGDYIRGSERRKVLDEFLRRNPHLPVPPPPPARLPADFTPAVQVVAEKPAESTASALLRIQAALDLSIDSIRYRYLPGKSDATLATDLGIEVGTVKAVREMLRGVMSDDNLIEVERKELEGILEAVFALQNRNDQLSDLIVEQAKSTTKIVNWINNVLTRDYGDCFEKDGG